MTETLVTGDVTAAIEGFGPDLLPVIKTIRIDLGMIDTLNKLFS